MPYEDACGGEGWQSLLIATDATCSDYYGGAYVCDSDLTGQEITNPSYFCKIKEYSFCSSSSQCWNDNGGYDCLGSSGNKICTTGDLGKSCFNNDNLDSDCINGQCSGGVCGGAGVVADLTVVNIKAIQIIPDVDLLLGRSGIIKVTVTNYGPEPANGTVTVKFDGSSLNIASGDSNTKPIPVNQNVSFLFDFTPNSTGTREVVANVTVV